MNTLSAGAVDYFATLSDYVGRGLPLLLVDSRPKPSGGYPITVADAAVHLRALSTSEGGDGGCEGKAAETAH